MTVGTESFHHCGGDMSKFELEIFFCNFFGCNELCILGALKLGCKNMIVDIFDLHKLILMRVQAAN